MEEKVNITVEANHHYNSSVKNGAEYTDVSYGCFRYGGGSPCDTEEEVQRAIKHAQEVIRSAGDIPILNDTREIKKLGEWF